MAKNYTLYPIKIIKDWHGEDWNVYEEKRLANGLMLYKGRLNEQVYGNNTGHILTPEFADYIKQNRSAKILYLAEQLECSKSVLMRFKRELGIQREMHIPDYEWVYAHQNELFVESFETLFEKYGLTKKQVQGYVVHLRKCKGISRTHRRDGLGINRLFAVKCFHV